MVLTWFFLSTKYRFKKIAGVVVCVAGLVMVVFSDVHAGDQSGKHMMFHSLYHNFVLPPSFIFL
jgi:drug/metabolite transporter (DMT)-like permease